MRPTEVTSVFLARLTVIVSPEPSPGIRQQVAGTPSSMLRASYRTTLPSKSVPGAAVAGTTAVACEVTLVGFAVGRGGVVFFGFFGFFDCAGLSGGGSSLGVLRESLATRSGSESSPKSSHAPRPATRRRATAPAAQGSQGRPARWEWVGSRTSDVTWSAN